MTLRTRAAELRALTASVLAAQNTLAGTRVEQERMSPLVAAEIPHLNVFMDESGEAEYQGYVRFRVTGKLQIKATAQRARLADAIDDLDTLVAQVKDALWGDPAWVRLANQVLSFSVQCNYRADADLHQAEALIQMSCEWREEALPRAAGPLAGLNVTLNSGVPGVTAPIEAAINLPAP